MRVSDRTTGGLKPLARRAAIPLLVVLTIWVYGAGTVLVVAHPVDAPDAIVSLASHEWERLPLAAEEASRAPSALVVLTHPEKVTVFNCHDCEHRVERLERLGVARARVRVVALRTGGTLGEALAVRELSARMHMQRLLIVTSPYHTRRALGIFQAVFAGSDVQIGIAPALRDSHARPATWWMAPYDRWYVAYEWAAIAFYAVRHGILPAR